MKKYVAKSVAEFVKIVAKVSSKEQELWFRGQSSAEFQLTPNLLRQKDLIKPHNSDEECIQKYSKTCEYRIPNFKYALSEFKRKSLSFIGREPKNDFEWMFLMQHYGAPTRLLDWTTNALVALYFAIPRKDRTGEYPHNDSESCTQEFLDTGFAEGGAAIYILNPIRINKIAQDLPEIVDVSSNFDKWGCYVFPEEYEDITFPICISAPHIDRRIRSQSGMFTLHGSRIEPIDWYSELKKYIYKIYFPREAWPRLHCEMKMLGMTPSFIFPDLDGIAKEISEQVYDKFWAYLKT